MSSERTFVLIKPKSHILCLEKEHLLFYLYLPKFLKSFLISVAPAELYLKSITSWFSKVTSRKGNRRVRLFNRKPECKNYGIIKPKSQVLCLEISFISAKVSKYCLVLIKLSVFTA